jgi:hypothetical protein
VRYAQGDIDGALKDYNKAIRLKPDLTDAYHNRAIARQAQDDIKGAERDDKEAARLGYRPSTAVKSKKRRKPQ